MVGAVMPGSASVNVSTKFGYKTTNSAYGQYMVDLADSSYYAASMTLLLNAADWLPDGFTVERKTQAIDPARSQTAQQ